jgi:hypothetical protein
MLNDLLVALKRAVCPKAALMVIMKMLEPPILFAYLSSTSGSDLIALLQLKHVYAQPVESMVTGLSRDCPELAVYTDQHEIADLPEALVLVNSPSIVRIKTLAATRAGSLFEKAGAAYVTYKSLSSIALPTVALDLSVSPIITAVVSMVNPTITGLAFVGAAGAADSALTGGIIKGSIMSGVNKVSSLVAGGKSSKKRVELLYSATYVTALLEAIFEGMTPYKMSFETIPPSVHVVPREDHINFDNIKTLLIKYVTDQLASYGIDPGRLVLSFIACFNDSRIALAGGGGGASRAGGRRTRKSKLKSNKSKKLKFKPRKSKKDKKRKTRRI